MISGYPGRVAAASCGWSSPRAARRSVPALARPRTSRASRGAPVAPSLVRDGDGALLAARRERDAAVARGEDRVVAADAGARAGAKPRAPLPDDDHPGLDLLAVEELHAQPLRLGVAPVLRGSETLLVCHR